jgi:hypothetical protein
MPSTSTVWWKSITYNYRALSDNKHEKAIHVLLYLKDPTIVILKKDSIQVNIVIDTTISIQVNIVIGGEKCITM